jgi:hypothetical protein
MEIDYLKLVCQFGLSILKTKCDANKKHSYEYNADANEKAPNMSWRLLSVSNFSSFTFCVAQG